MLVNVHEGNRGRSRKFRKGWLGHLPTCQLHSYFLFSENSFKIIQNFREKGVAMAPLAHPLNPPLGNALKNDHPAILLQVLRNVIIFLSKVFILVQINFFSLPFQLINHRLKKMTMNIRLNKTRSLESLSCRAPVPIPTAGEVIYPHPVGRPHILFLSQPCHWLTNLSSSKGR